MINKPPRNDRQFFLISLGVKCCRFEAWISMTELVPCQWEATANNGKLRKIEPSAARLLVLKRF